MPGTKETFKIFIGLTIAVFVSLLGLARSSEPPEGFTALFNGENLTGWHGMEHFSPYKLDAMTVEARQAKRKANKPSREW